MWGLCMPNLSPPVSMEGGGDELTGGRTDKGRHAI